MGESHEFSATHRVCSMISEGGQTAISSCPAGLPIFKIIGSTGCRYCTRIPTVRGKHQVNVFNSAIVVWRMGVVHMDVERFTDLTIFEDFELSGHSSI